MKIYKNGEKMYDSIDNTGTADNASLSARYAKGRLDSLDNRFDDYVSNEDMSTLLEDEIVNRSNFVTSPTERDTGIEIVLPQEPRESSEVVSDIDDSAEMKYSTVHTSSNNYINTKLDALSDSLVGKMNLQFVSALPSSPERNTQYYVETETAGTWDIYIVDNTGTVHPAGSTQVDFTGVVRDTRKVAGLPLSSDITAAQLADATKSESETLTNKTIDASTNTISNIETTSLKTGVLQTSIPETPTDSQLLSAKAIGTAMGTLVPQSRTIAGIPLDNNITDAVLEDKLKGVTATLTNKSIDVDNNTVTNLEVDNFKTGIIQTSMPESPADTQLLTAKAINGLLGFECLVGTNALTLNVSSPVTAMSFNSLADTQLFKAGSLCILTTMITFSKNSTSTAWLNVARIVEGYRPKRNTAFAGFLWNGNLTTGIGGHISTEGWLRWWVDGNGTAALNNSQLRIVCAYECA